MTTRVWLPFADESEARAALGPLPPGIVADYYQEGGEVPSSIGDVELIVAPYMAPPLPLLERVDEMAGLRAIHLQSAGYESVPPGAKLKVNVGNGMKGAQVTRVLEVDTSGAAERAPQRPSFGDSPRPRRVAPDPSTAVTVTGKVKWFDDTKGFGFVQSNDGGKDVFVHISVLGSSGLHGLAEGQPVTMRVVDTPKGREALSISAD